MLNSGPPELPRLIAASVWMKSSYGPWRISRPRAETMPAVTVPPRPNGLPIASTQSPTLLGVGIAEMHRRQRLVRCSPATGRCRRSRRGPSTLAFSEVLSCRVTVISSAPSITWLLVTTRPDASMMKPDPRLCIRRSGGGWASPRHRARRPTGLRLRKSLKNCSNGEPGGNIGISGPAPGPPARACAAWVDEMLTTAGSSLAARSAKLSGAPLAKAGSVGTPAASGMASATAKAERGGAGGWAADQAHGRTFSGGLAAYGPARGGWQLAYCPSGTGSD